MASTTTDIVLIGGLWLEASAWHAVVPSLRERGHRPLAVALPTNAAATLDDQLAAVLAAVDACPGRPLVVGHSAASTLAWLAADRRPGRVAGVALVGGMPTTEGEQYAPFFELVDGAMPFPGWEPFAGPDSDDLDDETRTRLARGAVPVPGDVAHGVVHYADPERKRVPVVMICPEYSPEDAKAWLEAGDIPELVGCDVSYVDIDSGHWPMLSAPEALAAVLSRVAAEVASWPGRSPGGHVPATCV